MKINNNNQPSFGMAFSPTRVKWDGLEATGFYGARKQIMKMREKFHVSFVKTPVPQASGDSFAGSVFVYKVRVSKKNPTFVENVMRLLGKMPVGEVVFNSTEIGVNKGKFGTYITKALEPARNRYIAKCFSARKTNKP